jgi:hypothetical protein
MRQEARRLWAATRVARWPGRYRIASFDHAALGWLAALVAEAEGEIAVLVVERDEVSAMLSERLWERVAGEARESAGPYAAITLDIPLDLGVVGYLAPAAERLAGAGVAILPVAAYLKDHLLVREEDAERAVGVLERLVEECRDEPV